MKLEVLYSILMSDDVVSSIKENQEELLKIIPELKYEIGFEHNHPHHHLDVWNHTLLALSMSIKDFEIRLALLLHDIGKPFSYQDKRGIRHFHNHADESEKIAKKVFYRIELSQTKTNEICYLIKYHDLPIEEQDLENNLEISLKRYEIQKCDALAHNPNKLEKRINYLKGIEEKIKLYRK